MKIIELEISNTRGVKAFHRHLNGEHMEVAGNTGTGKTTAVNALWDIIEKAPDSLTHGAKSGQVKVRVGDSQRWILAQRNATPKTSTVRIFDNNGDSITPKQFKDMLSSLAVNPHKIMDMKPKEQTEALLNAAELDIDLGAVDASIARLEEDRLEASRRVDRCSPGEEPEKVERVNSADIIAELDAANEDNAVTEQWREDLEIEKQHRDKLLAKIRDTKELLAELEEQHASCIANIDEFHRDLSCRVIIDTSPIKQRRADCDDINRKAVAYELWQTRSAEHAKAKEYHTDIDRQIKAEREARDTAMERAKWPIEGLSISDGNVTYNGILMQNLGQSEQMLVCVALSLADIERHPVHVVRLDGVESMSKADFSALVAMCDERGIQVLSTRVARGDTEPQEIVIVDGQYTDAE